jgi:hypothetical protein
VPIGVLLNAVRLHLNPVRLLLNRVEHLLIAVEEILIAVEEVLIAVEEMLIPVEHWPHGTPSLSASFLRRPLATAALRSRAHVSCTQALDSVM